MKKTIALALALLSLLGLLSGCGPIEENLVSAKAAEETTAETQSVPVRQIPEDGNPQDATCKGSYTGQGSDDAVVATVDRKTLTNGLLRVVYWSEAAAWKQSQKPEQPDWSRPLDEQSCAADETVRSWQQFFLKRALDTWHTAQALELQSKAVPLATEPEYAPDLEEHQEIMTGMPATKFLYGYHTIFEPNTMHQAYLDSIPQRLTELAAQENLESTEALAQQFFGASGQDLEDFVYLYNWSYMYFTNLTYGLEEVPLEEVPGEPLVTIRQIFQYPQQWDNPWREETGEQAEVAPDGTVTASEALWKAGADNAQKLMQSWRSGRRRGEATFANLAHQKSQDFGSGENGGLYRLIGRGQMPEAVEQWAFAEGRKHGDTTIVQSEYGFHLLYFVEKTTKEAVQQQQQTIAQQQKQLILDAKAAYPMEVSFDSIVLTEGKPEISRLTLLYPDVAHERFPEVPLYLQRDYPGVKYGAYPLRTHGCGITTMAMLASYLTDEEWTPPELSRRYGQYCHENGTDGMMFIWVPAELGFYLNEKVHNPTDARAALQDGHIVVVSQSAGFWTRGGHYLLLEKENADGTIQVRDSNLLNYERLEDHGKDAFDWAVIPPKCKGYWIYDKKIRTIPACVRCGDPEVRQSGLTPKEYICEKCAPAMLRRDIYGNMT